ncbi:transcription factor TFIIH complex subunit Tfb5-domain-containing protein [Bisporella sp. PMI_857]|nr:transcription factor TFIIH complex subunit Tfb5-domain-containing protein [Bisporella sp. PMI_857]
MVRAIRGTLVECDDAIKSLIVKIDKESDNAYIIEELDDQHLFIKEDMVSTLKEKLKETLSDSSPFDGSDSDDSDYENTLVRLRIKKKQT